MLKNIGSFDRFVRVGIGLSLIAISFVYTSPLAGLFGIFTLFEAASSWCIFYQLIGKNTCPIAKSSPNRKTPLLQYYLSGITILIIAIILNILAASLGWKTWYDIIRSTDQLRQMSLDNIVFLLVFYPLCLSASGLWVYDKMQKRKD